MGRWRKAGRVQPATNRPHHAVHHAAGSDHVGAGPGVNHRLLGQQGQRRVVVDVRPPGRLAQRAAMSVIGVLAKADVGNHQQVGKGRLRRADGLGDDARIARGVAPKASFSLECRRGSPRPVPAPKPREARPSGGRWRVGSCRAWPRFRGGPLAPAARTAAARDWPAKAAFPAPGGESPGDERSRRSRVVGKPEGMGSGGKDVMLAPVKVPLSLWERGTNVCPSG